MAAWHGTCFAAANGGSSAKGEPWIHWRARCVTRSAAWRGRRRSRSPSCSRSRSASARTARCFRRSTRFSCGRCRTRSRIAWSRSWRRARRRGETVTLLPCVSRSGSPATRASKRSRGTSTEDVSETRRATRRAVCGGQDVAPNFLDVWRVEPLLGRDFVEADTLQRPTRRVDQRAALAQPLRRGPEHSRRARSGSAIPSASRSRSSACCRRRFCSPIATSTCGFRTSRTMSLAQPTVGALRRSRPPAARRDDRGGARRPRRWCKRGSPRSSRHRPRARRQPCGRSRMSSSVSRAARCGSCSARYRCCS